MPIPRAGTRRIVLPAPGCTPTCLEPDEITYLATGIGRPVAQCAYLLDNFVTPVVVDDLSHTVIRHSPFVIRQSVAESHNTLRYFGDYMGRDDLGV